jgi:hypothetical protein
MQATTNPLPRASCKMKAIHVTNSHPVVHMHQGLVAHEKHCPCTFLASCNAIMNCSIYPPQHLTLWSTCTRGLLPMNSAPISCSAGISRGKLKGVMSATGPYGQRRPWLVWPMWSPGTLKPRAVKRT